jgi:hypothetical protein
MMSPITAVTVGFCGSRVQLARRGAHSPAEYVCAAGPHAGEIGFLETLDLFSPEHQHSKKNAPHCGALLAKARFNRRAR